MRFFSTSSLAVGSLLWTLSAAQEDGASDTGGGTEAPFDIYESGIESGYVQNITEGSGPQINQDRVVDFNYCYGALSSHDVDGNQRITETEFFNFAQDFGRATECLAVLEEIPLEMRVVWNQLACECRIRGGAADCCIGPNAHIPITGVSREPPLIIEEQLFLRAACLRTDQAIITYCGPPPPPIIPGPPIAIVRSGPPVQPPVSAAERGIIGAVAALFIILCCFRRRWCFFPVGKGEESSDESSSSSEDSDDESDAGGMRHVVTEEGGGDIEDPAPPVAAAMDEEQGLEAEPEDDAMQLRAVGEEEDGQFGGTSYGRSVQEPEWEDVEGDRGAGYEQYDLPDEGEDPMALLPIPPTVTEEVEEPYDLEHYVPDGGIVEYEREGEWAYDANGGWAPDEVAENDPNEWDREAYDRAQAEAPAVVDNRRQRTLEALGSGEIFNQLDQEFTESASGQPDDMFDWVIRSTLNTLDQTSDDLKGSHHDKTDDV